MKGWYNIEMSRIGMSQHSDALVVGCHELIGDDLCLKRLCV